MTKLILTSVAAAALALGATIAEASPLRVNTTEAAGILATDVSAAKKKARKARATRSGRDAKGTGGGRGGESGSGSAARM
jgi:hypothetical protein